MPDTAADELLSLERERCRAISAADAAALGGLLSGDLTHTHSSGRIEDKAAYLAGLSLHPRETTRGADLRVRVYGDAAVMTGTMRDSYPPSEPGVAPRVVERQVTQVWARQPGAWKLVAFQASEPLPPA